MEGTFNLARKMFDGHDEFWPAPGSRPYTRGEAWVDLLYQARFRDTETGRLEVPRGAFAASLRGLAERWSWSVKQVRRFLRKCETVGRIRAHGRAHYVLVNYDTYQPTPSEKGTRKGTGGGPKGAHAYIRTKETKEEKKYTDEFDLLWVAWKGRPNNPKKPARQKYTSLRNSGISFEELKDATRAYHRYCKHQRILGTGKMLQAQTFFGPNERWKADFTISAPDEPLSEMGHDDGSDVEY
jgi:hypothetical protein